MASNPDLALGKKVLIHFNPKDISVAPGMIRFNNTEAEISKIYKSRTHFGKQWGRQYELKGVESEFGIPYIFTGDMLFDAGEGCYE